MTWNTEVIYPYRHTDTHKYKQNNGGEKNVSRQRPVSFLEGLMIKANYVQAVWTL